MNQRLNPMTGRPKTLASEPLDEIVNVVSTGLIIGMIISLVFFLVIAFYRGDYDMRLMYILGLYVFATVLVARIAIDSGRAYANAFGLALFAAASLAMFRFVSITGPMSGLSPVINIGLLLVAWFLADRITFDCTWINERDPSYQIGLLQSLKLIDAPKAPIKPPNALPAGESISADGANNTAPARRRKNPVKKHNPGVWVLYFALLAIPLFGLGQITISNDRARAEAFKYLIAYLTCSLLLLLTTNFAGMRRYLRQRGTAMPDDMSRVWISYGGIGIAMILIACLLLPLPTKSGVGFAWLPFDFTSPHGLSANRFGWGKEGPDSGNSSAATSEQPAGQANPLNGDGKGNSRPNAAQGKPKEQKSQEESNGSPQPSKKGATSQNSQNSEEPNSRSSQTSDPQSTGQSSDQSSDASNNPNGPPTKQSSPESKPATAESQDTRSGNGKPNESSQSESPGAGKRNSPNGQPQSSQDANQPPSPEQTKENRRSESSEKKPSDTQSPDKKPSSNLQEPNPQKPGPNVRPNAQQRQQQSDTEAGQQQSPNERPQSSAPQSPAPQSSAPQSSANPPTAQPQMAPSNWPNFSIPNLESIVKWLLIAALVAIVGLYAILYPQEIARLWRSIVEFFASLFGNRKAVAVVAQTSKRAEKERVRMERPSFSSFLDPFSNNRSIEPKEVVVQTFAALEAWAHEHGVDRLPDQTAEEFSRRLTQTHPSLNQHAALVAQMHDRILFAGWSPKPNEVLPLANLWRILKGN